MSRFILAISWPLRKVRRWSKNHAEHLFGGFGVSVGVVGLFANSIPVMILALASLVVGAILEHPKASEPVSTLETLIPPDDSPEQIAARETEARDLADARLADARRKLESGMVALPKWPSRYE